MPGYLLVHWIVHSANCRVEIGALERELEGSKKQVESERKKQDELLRERDILTKLKVAAEGTTARQLDLIKINDNTKRHLEQELQGYKVQLPKCNWINCSPLFFAWVERQPAVPIRRIE